MGGDAPLEANLPVMLGTLASSIILTGAARQEGAAAAAVAGGEEKEGQRQQQQQQRQIGIPTVLNDLVALAALHALVRHWQAPEAEAALEQVLGDDALLELACAGTSGDTSLGQVPRLSGVTSVNLGAWAQYIRSRGATSDSSEGSTPGGSSSTGRVSWASMSPEARREVQRAALKVLVTGSGAGVQM
jgi:hypothetical protein